MLRDSRICWITDYLCSLKVHDTMIPYEQYNKENYDEDDFGENLPVTAIVIMIVLFSLAGIFIVCSAIYGL